MKNFNLKLALKKRWSDFALAFVWLLVALNSTKIAIDTGERLAWLTAACSYGCTICWVLIFYKRAKRDGA